MNRIKSAVDGYFVFSFSFEHKKTALIHVEYNPDKSGFECLPGQTSNGSFHTAPRGDEACLSGHKRSLLRQSVEFTNLMN